MIRYYNDTQPDNPEVQMSDIIRGGSLTSESVLLPQYQFSVTIDIYTAVNQQHVNIFYYDAPQRDELKKLSLSHLSTVMTLLSFHPFYKDEWPDY